MKTAARYFCLSLFVILEACAPRGKRPDLSWIEASTPPPKKRLPEPAVTVSPVPTDLRVKEAKLENGLRIVALSKVGFPVAELSLVLDGGSLLDEARHGEALLSSSIYFGQGSGTRRADLVKSLVASGSDFSMRVASDHVAISVVGEDAQLEAMMQFLAIAATKGNVDEPSLETRKLAMLDELWEVKRSPERWAVDQLPELTFGARHPYGHSALGSRRTVAVVDLARVKANLARTLCPERAILVAAGPLTLEAVSALARQSFGKWKKCLPAPPVSLAGTVSERKEVRIVEDTERSQFLVLGAIPVLGLDAEGAASLEALSEVLGGSVASRLQAALRSAGGFTYDVHTAVELRRGAGILYVETSLDAERFRPALERLLGVFGELAKSPPTLEELARAELRTSTARRARAATAEGATALAIGRLTAGLPLADPPFPSRDEVAAFAAEHVRPELLQLVLVGDPKALEAAVKDAGLGTPRLVQ